MNQDALISEIAEWSRKLKNLDSQRRSHQDEQEKILNSQRQQIEALKQENAKLQDGLLQDSQARADIFNPPQPFLLLLVYFWSSCSELLVHAGSRAPTLLCSARAH